MAVEIPRRGPAATPDIRVPEVVQPTGIQETRALTQVGGAIAGLGGALEQRQRELEQERKETSVQGVWNDIYGELSKFVADEAFNKTGEQAEGNVERYKAKRQELLDQFTVDLDPDSRDFLKERLTATDTSNISRLSEVQARERSKSRVLGVQNAISIFEDRAATDPESIDDVIEDLDDTLFTIDPDSGTAIPIFGAEQTEAVRLEARENIALNAMQGMHPQDALDALKAGEFDDLITNVESKDQASRALEAKIRNQKAIDKQKVEAAQEQWRNNALVQLNNGTLSFQDILRSPVDATEKERWAKKIEGFGKRSDRYLKSNSQTYADLATAVYTAPDTVTEEGIFDLIGKTGDDWISTADAEKLTKQLRSQRGGKTNANRTKLTTTILQNFQRDFKNGLFKDPESTEAILEYSRQVRDFLAWMEVNPEGDPTQYYADSVKPFEATLRQTIIDFMPFIDKVQDGGIITPETRALRRQEIRGRRTGAPTIEEFLRESRKVEANKDFSDKELREFYNKKYGG